MATQTSKLKLSKPSYTDTADIGVIGTNMQIIDDEFVKVDGELVKLNNNKANTKHTHAITDITGLELSSTKVNRPNGKTVESSIVDNETLLATHTNDIKITDGIAKDSWTKASANATDIANLKTKVDNGQNHKLTNDNGTYIFMNGVNIDNLSPGWYNVNTPYGTLPPNYTSDSDFLIEHKGIVDLGWARQIAYDVRSYNKFERIKTSNSWQPWRSL